MPKLRRGLGWLLLVVMLVAQVWVLYLLVPGEGEPYFAHQDKVGHVLLFGAPFALALLLRARRVALGILLHALLSEPLQQVFTTTRSMDVWDTVADLVGIALAVLAVALIRRVPERSPEREPADAGVWR
ncbi:VanZ family protein [Ornithinimicrobium sp. F0845]|uniref:VanZ family protein n=1 Tax=Ornithinimicrobium sp. F0845 TaxID=2926412 RepID=UPI001FF47FE1|nr:VanZ family protein [Ornithinimicrobium sp. F0845]MCK0111343.1 VanZ family protein [Ornithinimicrobium sp. F0845]